MLYQQGDATLREEAESPLGRFVDLALESEHRIMIEGHTDDIPIQTARFPSNWELSAARAIAAMRFVVGRGIDAGRVGVAGCADLRSLEPNTTPENRALNRRVEFVFVGEDDDANALPAAAEASTEPAVPASTATAATIPSPVTAP